MHRGEEWGETRKGSWIQGTRGSGDQWNMKVDTCSIPGTRVPKGGRQGGVEGGRKKRRTVVLLGPCDTQGTIDRLRDVNLIINFKSDFLEMLQRPLSL